MDSTAYNKKLAFVADNGDVSESGALYREYRAVVEEWYGELIAEDALVESGSPVNDFREWFNSRLMESADEKDGDQEICVSFLDEIERIK
jgi:beta-xylosidase